jgi:hypothetical protein
MVSRHRRRPRPETSMKQRTGLMRKWFGPSREEMWRQLAHETSGRYVDGSFLKGAVVEVSHDEWTITLDSYAVSTGKTTIVFTRMRAPYVNPDGFRFAVSRAGMFTEIAKWLGMQDVETGIEEFDRDFVIKGTSEEKLRALFANARLRELLDAQKSLHFAVKHDRSWFREDQAPDVDTLEFHVPGIITDIERLKLLFDLFAETLDELCRIGSAYEHAPEKTAN